MYIYINIACLVRYFICIHIHIYIYIYTHASPSPSLSLFLSLSLHSLPDSIQPRIGSMAEFTAAAEHNFGFAALQFRAWKVVALQTKAVRVLQGRTLTLSVALLARPSAQQFQQDSELVLEVNTTDE